MMAFLIGCKKDATTGPQLFQPSVISTADVEYGGTFSPDGSEFYFVRAEGKWGTGSLASTIYYSKLEKGKWSDPVVASFSGQYDDSDPHLTEDGHSLYFISSRPATDSVQSADIWKVTKGEDGRWSEPYRLDDPINSNHQEYSPFTTASGDLYFASDRPGGFGQGDLYVAHQQDGEFTTPINLGSSLNSAQGEWNLSLDRDGNTLLFEASGRPKNQSSYGDLYISYRDSSAWSVPQNLAELNTTGSDLYPLLIDAGQTLIYSSSDSLKSGVTNIYQVDFQAIHNRYKERAIWPQQGLLVVNRSGHNVALVDSKRGNILKEIPVGIGPHEIALSSDNRRAFVANYGSYPKPHQRAISSKELRWMDEPQNTVTKIDLSDHSTQTFSIPGSVSHHGILTNRDGSLFWVTAEKDGVVKEIDGTTGEVQKIYSTMPGSHIIRSTANYDYLFVANIESNTVTAINRLNEEIWHIATPKNPEGMEVSPDGRHLWVLCNGAQQAVLINLQTLVIDHYLDTQGKFPIKLTFINDEVWIANVASKNISIFDRQSRAFKTHISLETTPLSIIAAYGQVFVTLPRKNLVRQFDPVSRQILGEFSTGIEPDGMVPLLLDGNDSTPFLGF